MRGNLPAGRQGIKVKDERFLIEKLPFTN